METKDRIKELIKKTGLSQDRFAAAYGIPKNTVHNWCQGVNEPPEYLIQLIAKDVAAQKLIPTAWVWTEYRDKAGTGHFEVFRTREEAEAAAHDYWERLAAVDKKKYLDDPCGEFFTGLYLMEYDDTAEEYVPDFGSGVIVAAWSPMNRAR